MAILSIGKKTPDVFSVYVTYSQQVCVVAPGVDRAAIGDDLALLSTMPEVYRRLYGSNRHAMYWQYAALESGLHTCYPGHGGYPPEHDPRTRPWYQAAKRESSLTWLLPHPEVSTRTVTLVLSMWVWRPGDWRAQP